MTKMLGGAPKELDLDSFLDPHSNSSSDEDDSCIALRTVDEILNDSDSSSSDGNIPRSRRLLSPSHLLKLENEDLSEEVSRSTPQTTSSIHRTSSVTGTIDLLQNNGASAVRKIGSYGRRSNGELSDNILFLGQTSTRSLPPVFGGFKTNPKPGDALAAAAAASRSVPTPHAAALKIKRASFGGTLLKAENLLESVNSEVRVDDVDNSGSFEFAQNEAYIDVGTETEQAITNSDGEYLEDRIHPSWGSEASKIVENPHEGDGFHSLQEIEVQKAVASPIDADDVVGLEFAGYTPDLENAHTSSEGGNASKYDSHDKHSVPLDVVKNHVHTPENDDFDGNFDFSLLSSPTNRNEKEIPYTSQNDNISIVDETRLFPISEEVDLNEAVPIGNDDIGISNAEDNANSKSDAMELMEELSFQLDTKRASRKIAKKLLSSSRPLEVAEELEKTYASSGLHWEEGAAAQPMRLEGIRRGPPAVGYMQVNSENAITRTIASQALRRDHGSPQVLAVHLNYIAVGMSRGSVLVIPSKHSPHHVDNMDGKMSVLGSQSEKSHSPVTSMCFHPQGDLLLVGYGDGHLTIWDVPKAAVAKTVLGEHTAPVVHTLFLGIDSQNTRQFKAVTGDCKGLVLLHAFTVVPVLNHISVKTQCLLDGQRTEIVLSASPLFDDSYGGSLSSIQNNAGGFGGMMGGVVGGVVGRETGWKLFSDGSTLLEEGVVIFVTNQKALVVRLAPNLEVFAQVPKLDGVREGSVPYTAWKCIPCPSASLSEPVPADASNKASLVAIAWDRKVLVAKLVKSKLEVYKEWALDFSAIGVAWLDDRMVVVLTLRWQLFLFSKDGTELHRTSFMVDGFGGDDAITYHTHFINIFGNPEKAYHNSIAVRGATIYILGPTHLLVSRLLPWKERIQVLQKAGDWMGALDMAMRLYDGQADGVIDLPRTIDAIRESIMQYLVELLLSYVDVVFSYISVAFCNQIEREEVMGDAKINKSALHSDIKEQYARVGGVAVEFCVHIKRTDILFDDIFSKFVAVQQRGTFLEILEPYILKDMLGCLPPEIMQALVEHYSSKGWLQRVEQCVLHMDIGSLDFNQVVKLCREHGLYGALIYLFNKGLDDFKTPLEELLLVLQNSQKMNAIVIGYRMLVYLKYCFLGLAFPPGHGTIPPSRLQLLRRELLNFLLDDSRNFSSEVTVKLKSSVRACPNLCYLLWLDTEASLEVLKHAFFEEENLNSNYSVHNSFDESTEEIQNHDTINPESKNSMTQYTIDALIQILDMEISEGVQSSSSGDNELLETWPSREDVGHILEFVAYFVAKRKATVAKSILNRILEYLTDNNPLLSTFSKKGEITRRREKQVLALLKVLPETDWDSFHLLNLCKKVQFYQVCGFIHRIKGQYVDALECYMKDVDEPLHAFVFINYMLCQSKETLPSAFKSAVISRVPELVNLSREATVFLIIDQFGKETLHIESKLQAHPESHFLYLKTVVEAHLSGTIDFSSLKRGKDLYAPISSSMADQSDEFGAYMEKVSDFPKILRRNPIHLTDEMAELYVELLCQYERSSVLRFLETFENYRVEHCLRLCQKYEIEDAAAFLLERVGDVGSALSLTLSSLVGKLHMLNIAVETTVTKIKPSGVMENELFNYIMGMKEANAVLEVLHMSIGLCQRNTSRLDPQESESLWFGLLDSFCKPLRALYGSKEVSVQRNKAVFAKTSAMREGQQEPVLSEKGAWIFKKLLSRFIQDIVEGMIGYVPLPAIMAKLLSDNGSQEFGVYKLTILGMLGTYGYERRILATAKSLIEDDTYYTMSLLKKGACHAYSPRSSSCCICNYSFSKDSSSLGIRVFSCGHATHLRCEIQENDVSNEDDLTGCPICLPKKKSSRARNKIIIMQSGLVNNSLSRTQQVHGINMIHNTNEGDLWDRCYTLNQMPRFEMLCNLSKSHKSLQFDTIPQLKLSPPAIYHEKVKKGYDLLSGESSRVTLKSEKPSKIRQTKDPKAKGSSFRFPIKSSLFNIENRRK